MKNDANVERAWVHTLSNERIDDPVHTTPSENDFRSYGTDADVIMKIDKGKIKDLFGKDADLVLRNALKRESKLKSRKRLATCYSSAMVTFEQNLDGARWVSGDNRCRVSQWQGC